MGAWVSGDVLSVSELRVARLIFEGGRYRIISKDNVPLESGEYSTDETVLPAAIDLCGSEGSGAGRVLRGIVELSDDLLTLSYDLAGGERPESTVPREEQMLLTMTYLRVATFAS